MPTGIYKHKSLTEETKRKVSLSNIGKHFHVVSDEAKKRMSLASIGRKNPHSENAKRNMSLASKGKLKSEEHKKKLSESKKRFFQNGGRPWNYRGGIAPENVRIRTSAGYRMWREIVFRRDNFTCWKCRLIGFELEAHHLLGFAEYPELRFVSDNGITFCKKCHALFHKKYGRKNNTKEQVMEFLNK